MGTFNALEAGIRGRTSEAGVRERLVQKNHGKQEKGLNHLRPQKGHTRTQKVIAPSQCSTCSYGCTPFLKLTICSFHWVISTTTRQSLEVLLPNPGVGPLGFGNKLFQDPCELFLHCHLFCKKCDFWSNSLQWSTLVAHCLMGLGNYR